jgi:hypothetical protein
LYNSVFSKAILVMIVRKILHFARPLHLGVGIFVAVYIALIGISGMVLNHSRSLRLDDRYVSRTWLPSSYRMQETAVRADVALNDFHSGLLSGRTGAPVMGTVAAFSMLLLTSGLLLFRRRALATGEPAVARQVPQEMAAPVPDRPFLVSRGQPQRAKVLMFRNDR